MTISLVLMNDFDRTLTQIENHDWGPPSYNSHLVTECHRLRNVALRELGIEDLGTLIGLAIGLNSVVPIAIDKLQENPWAEGYMYPGCLMKTIAKVPTDYWSENPAMILRFQSVLDEVEQRWRFYNDEVLPMWKRVFGGG